MSLSQLLREFREVISTNNINTVAFAGIPGFCQPFAELFGFVIRDKELYFIPYTNYKDSKKLILKENIGLQMEDFGELDKVDCLVIFGGLAMKKFNISEDNVQALINSLSPKLTLGICFMSMFKKANWKIKFDYLFDIYISYEVER
ncbi:DUF2124 family protein [Methanocaldococcus infernus]|nr:DUF2124 family protein [Methanocaldococcus infernus]